MYIQKSTLTAGRNVYLTMTHGKGREIGMDVSLLVLEEGETFTLLEPKKEAALLLFCGALTWSAGNEEKSASRSSEFAEEASCLHVCRGTRVFVRASAHCELYLQMVKNER